MVEKRRVENWNDGMVKRDGKLEEWKEREMVEHWKNEIVERNGILE